MPEGNRKDPRARVLNMTVRYKSATVDEFIENHSHDISKGGIFIKTRSPFPAGTLLKFEVRIAEDKKLMHGVGRVVWRREAERAEESFPPGMGIKFIKTGEGAAELISQLVAARAGDESTFDVGVRQASQEATGKATEDEVDDEAVTATPGAVAIKSPSLPAEMEIKVSSPPKKRADQAPDKRKVVLKEAEVVDKALEKKVDSRPRETVERTRSYGPPEGRAARAAAQPPQTEATSGGSGFTALIVVLALAAGVAALINSSKGGSSEPQGAEPLPALTAEKASAVTDPQPTEEPAPTAEPATAEPATAEPATDESAAVGEEVAPVAVEAPPDELATAKAGAPTATPVPPVRPKAPAPPSVEAAAKPTVAKPAVPRPTVAKPTVAKPAPKPTVAKPATPVPPAATAAPKPPAAPAPPKPKPEPAPPEPAPPTATAPAAPAPAPVPAPQPPPDGDNPY